MVLGAILHPHNLVIPVLFINSSLCSSNAYEEYANKESIEKHQAVIGDNIEGGKGIYEDGSGK